MREDIASVSQLEINVALRDLRLKQWVREAEEIAAELRSRRGDSEAAPTSHPGEDSHPPVADDGEGPQVILPLIQLEGFTLWCNRTPIPYETHPLSIRLFEGLLRDPERPKPSEELIDHVYGHGDLRRASPQFQASANQKFVKLISRTRRIANSVVNANAPWIDWLWYDSEARLWEPYRLRNTYIAAVELRWRKQRARLVDQLCGADFGP